MIRLTNSSFSIDAAAPDGTPKRTITGVALPYNTEATVTGGQVVTFMPGSLPTDGKAPKLFMSHDSTQAIGLVTEREEDETAMYFVAKVSTTALGDEALILAADGVLDSVSVGVNPTKFTYNEDGVMIVEAASWLELSLVPTPAFEGSVITQVAASSDANSENICNNDNSDDGEPEDATELIEETPVETTPAAPEVIEASAPLYAQPKRAFKMPSAAEYMAAMHIGGDTFRAVNLAYKDNLRQNSTALEFALAQDLTTDTAGLLEQRLLGPVIQDLSFMRPVVTALGVSAMPSTPSKTFTKTKISQHTSVSTQTEGSAVTSQKMTLSANTVTKSTQAGGVFISQQDIDFTAIPALETIINDLSGEYMIRTDDVAADALVSAATASGSTWTFSQTDPTSLVNALYDAAREMAEDTNYFPTHIYCAPNVWEKLGRQLDSQNRPVFGYVGANNNISMNGLGGNAGGLNYNSINPLGLEVVVSNNFASGTMIVAHTPRNSATSAFSFYEEIRGIMTVENAELLGRDVTFYGYIATFANIPVCIQSITTA
jgi:HK97 family phage prohead protease